MYMLQIERERPIESMPLRNGIFWEQRQLVKDKIVSSPAIDHIDLFPHDVASFQDTLEKLGKRWIGVNCGYSLHYLFAKMRLREFLLLPVEIDSHWLTVIARMRPKLQATIPPADCDWDLGPLEYTDREVTDLAIVDPLPNDQESRRDLIRRRLVSILAQGCIELSTEVNVRDIAVPDIDCTTSHRWKTGLVSYAISREFLRRLKTLQWRRDQGVSDSDGDFLWAPFEEHYNFDAYRQNLMSACAHQCIEMSNFRVRMALDVASDESNYDPKNLSHIKDESYFEQDEKWEVFQSPTHAFAFCVETGIVREPSIGPELDYVMPSDDDFSEEELEDLSEEEGEEEQEPISLASFGLHEEKGSSALPIDVESEGMASSAGEAEGAGDTSGDIGFDEYQLSGTGTNENNAPDAPMGEYDFSPRIPGLSLITVVKQDDAIEETQHKRSFSEVEEEDEDENGDDGMPSAKRLKI